MWLATYVLALRRGDGTSLVIEMRQTLPRSPERRAFGPDDGAAAKPQRLGELLSGPLQLCGDWRRDSAGERWRD
jgi:hypothetical protein